MRQHDFATALGAGLVLGLFAVLGFVAAFGVDSLGVVLGQSGAAWVQAVGSVGAILAAIWISNSSERKEEDRAENLSSLFHINVVVCLNRAIEACAAKNISRLRSSEAVLRDTQRIGHEIPLTRIARQHARDVLALRERVARALVEVNELLEQATHVIKLGDIQALHESLEAIREEVIFKSWTVPQPA